MSAVATAGIRLTTFSLTPSTEMNYDEAQYFQDSLNSVLMELVNKNKIEMGVDENGQFVFWMTDEQREAYYKELEEEG